VSKEKEGKKHRKKERKKDRSRKEVGVAPNMG
jgi:hypothetical protein